MYFFKKHPLLPSTWAKQGRRRRVGARQLHHSNPGKPLAPGGFNGAPPVYSSLVAQASGWWLPCLPTQPRPPAGNLRNEGGWVSQEASRAEALGSWLPPSSLRPMPVASDWIPELPPGASLGGALWMGSDSPTPSPTLRSLPLSLCCCSSGCQTKLAPERHIPGNKPSSNPGEPESAEA